VGGDIGDPGQQAPGALQPIADIRPVAAINQPVIRPQARRARLGGQEVHQPGWVGKGIVAERKNRPLGAGSEVFDPSNPA